MLTLLAVVAACCGLISALFVLPYGQPRSAYVLIGIVYDADVPGQHVTREASAPMAIFDRRDGPQG